MRERARYVRPYNQSAGITRNRTQAVPERPEISAGFFLFCSSLVVGC